MENSLVVLHLKNFRKLHKIKLKTKKPNYYILRCEWNVTEINNKIEKMMKSITKSKKWSIVHNNKDFVCSTISFTFRWKFLVSMASFRIFVKLNSKPLNNFIFISSVKILLIIKIIYSNRGKYARFTKNVRASEIQD